MNTDPAQDLLDAASALGHTPRRALASAFAEERNKCVATNYKLAAFWQGVITLLIAVADAEDADLVDDFRLNRPRSAGGRL